MEFGKVASEELEKIDFTLPADGQHTANVLNNKGAEKPAILLGCARWGTKDWIDYLYPLKTKEVNFLDEYAKHFNSIELNAAYHTAPSIETIRKWKKKVNTNARGDFFFCPKFPRIISHDLRLTGAAKVTDDFISAITEFRENLGACFLQLSDSFGPDNFLALKNYLEALPQDLTVFVELRQEQWFTSPAIRSQVLNLLTRLRKGIVITDVAGRRDVLHMEVTIPEVFIRFIGNGARQKELDFARIDEWAKRLKSWQDKGLKKIHFFVHQHNERDTLTLANYTIKVFNEVLGSTLPKIILQPSLFVGDE